MKAAKRPQTVTTLRVLAGPQGRFEVRDGLLVLGTSQNELMALWTAVTVAEEMSKSGRKARVVRLVGGDEVEEWPDSALQPTELPSAKPFDQGDD